MLLDMLMGLSGKSVWSVGTERTSELEWYMQLLSIYCLLATTLDLVGTKFRGVPLVATTTVVLVRHICPRNHSN